MVLRHAEIHHTHHTPPLHAARTMAYLPPLSLHNQVETEARHLQQCRHYAAGQHNVNRHWSTYGYTMARR